MKETKSEVGMTPFSHQRESQGRSEVREEITRDSKYLTLLELLIFSSYESDPLLRIAIQKCVQEPDNRSLAIMNWIPPLDSNAKVCSRSGSPDLVPCE